MNAVCELLGEKAEVEAPKPSEGDPYVPEIGELVVVSKFLAPRNGDEEGLVVRVRARKDADKGVPCIYLDADANIRSRTWLCGRFAHVKPVEFKAGQRWEFQFLPSDPPKCLTIEGIRNGIVRVIVGEGVRQHIAVDELKKILHRLVEDAPAKSVERSPDHALFVPGRNERAILSEVHPSSAAFMALRRLSAKLSGDLASLITRDVRSYDATPNSPSAFDSGRRVADVLDPHRC